jgi:chromosome segregation ATPase
LPRTEKLEEKVQKFEDKIRLSNLLSEKRFADLELKIGQLSERLNEITTEFPKLKDRASDIEDILNVVNLGLMSYKEKFEEVSNRISEFVQLPDAISSIRLNLENKIKDIDENFKTISANLEVLNNIKEDVIKSTEETISSKADELGKGIDQNKVEIEHIKSDLDGFSMALKALGRTIELTNLDDIIKRFDSLDRKVMNAENQIEKFRYLIPDLSMAVSDMEILKKKFKEMSSTVMDTMSRMNQFEGDINRKITFLEDLTKKAEGMNLIQPVSKSVEEGTKQEEVKTVESSIPVDYQLKISGLEEEVKKSKELPLEIKSVIEELKERINGLESRSTTGTETTPVGVEEVKDRVEGLGKSIENINKMLSERQRGAELPQIGKEVPKNLVDEISSLKGIISRVSSENEDFKKLMRDLRINQMQMITSDVLVDFIKRMSTLEKKISEVEKDLSKVRRVKPFVLE